MNRELSRFELAIVKRTAQNTKSLRTKRDKLVEKIEKAQEELGVINEAIESFEAPVKTMTGGFTSEEVLAGIMAVAAPEEVIEEAEVSANPFGDAVSANPFGEEADEMPFKD